MVSISISLKAEAVTGRFGPQSQWVAVSLVPSHPWVNRYTPSM